METEFKFALSPEARRAIEGYLLVHGEDAAVDSHIDRTTYFDTADLALLRTALSVRIRHRVDDGANGGGTYVQTVKARGNGWGLRREDWEWSVAGADLDRERLEEVPGLLSMLKDGIDLQPAFCTEVRRCERLLHPGGDGRVALALDDGVVVAARQSEPLSELELELKGGSEDSLLRFGLDLVQAAALSLQVESKAERGYRLQQGRGPGARKAAAVIVDPHAPAAEGFARLADSALAHLLANQPAALRGDQMEGVHQMRVAVRRLHSLLVLFAPVLEAHGRLHFTQELRRFGDCLGSARDWDVLAEDTLQQAEADGVDRGWVGLLRGAVEERRHAAHQAAKKAIGEPDFARFALSLRAWSGCRTAALASDAKDMPLDRLAPDLLDRLEKKAAKRLDRSDADEPVTLHALRKSVKKLRYGVEHLDALFGPEAARYAKRCNVLQKKLGALNDLETAECRVAELAENGRLDLVPAMGALMHWVEARRPKLLKRALKACAAYSRANPFWR
jgi:inorganic triphosphatase YgiF